MRSETKDTVKWLKLRNFFADGVVPRSVCKLTVSSTPAFSVTRGRSSWLTPKSPGCGEVRSPVSVVTDANGHYCLDLPGPGGYTITEVQQTGWSMIEPPQPYKVFIECIPTPTGIPGSVVMQGPGTANRLDFLNVNLCGGNQCPAPSQCEVHEGKPVCVKPAEVSPCALIKCGFGTHCALINGSAVCIP
jgi:hypothetical protein